MRRLSLPCLALLAVGAPLAAQRHLYTLDGGRPDDLLGWSVAPAGDVDRDGYPDLLAGAPFELSVGTEAGQRAPLVGA